MTRVLTVEELKTLRKAIVGAFNSERSDFELMLKDMGAQDLIKEEQSFKEPYIDEVLTGLQGRDLILSLLELLVVSDRRLYLDTFKKIRTALLTEPPTIPEPPELSKVDDTDRPPPPKFTQIILLGEPLTTGGDDLANARKALLARLETDFDGKDITVADFGDSWIDGLKPEAMRDAATVLFVRVVNARGLRFDRSLGQLGSTLQDSLKLGYAFPISHMILWSCDGSGASDSKRPEFAIEVRYESSDEFSVFLKSRAGLERSPPTFSIDNSGDATAIEATLVDVIGKRTRVLCKPPDPATVPLSANKGDNAGLKLRAQLTELLDAEGSRRGVIIAIHDLDRPMADSPLEMGQFRTSLMQYDAVLKKIMKETMFPAKMIVKIAVLMELAKFIESDDDKRRWAMKDWMYVRMKRQNDDAILIDEEEKYLAERIDQLLGLTK